MLTGKRARGMVMPVFVLFIAFFAASLFAAGAPPLHLGYYTWPDLHGNTIVFTSEGDLWTVDVRGGAAHRLTSDPGRETHARISPDGTTVAVGLVGVAFLMYLALFWTSVKAEYREFATKSSDSQNVKAAFDERFGYLGSRIAASGNIDWSMRQVELEPPVDRYMEMIVAAAEQLEVEAEYTGFAELWDAVLDGAGPAGSWAKSLDASRRAAAEEELHGQLGSPSGPFSLAARAWAARVACE